MKRRDFVKGVAVLATLPLVGEEPKKKIKIRNRTFVSLPPKEVSGYVKNYVTSYDIENLYMSSMENLYGN
jgi:hypothetical protein